MPKGRKKLVEKEEVTTGTNQQGEKVPVSESLVEKKPEVKAEPETVSIPKAEWENVQKTLEMLKSVADKGRVYNYESQQKTDKKPKSIHLGQHDGGIIIWWDNMKRDDLTKHPVTGATVGESQAIDVKILMPNGEIKTKEFGSYVSFSNARYDKTIIANVVGVSEKNGVITWNIVLPDGREIEISPTYVN